LFFQPADTDGDRKQPAKRNHPPKKIPMAEKTKFGGLGSKPVPRPQMRSVLKNRETVVSNVESVAARIPPRFKQTAERPLMGQSTAVNTRRNRKAIPKGRKSASMVAGITPSNKASRLKAMGESRIVDPKTNQNRPTKGRGDRKTAPMAAGAYVLACYQGILLPSINLLTGPETHLPQ
jgi:hypothetical protein